MLEMEEIRKVSLQGDAKSYYFSFLNQSLVPKRAVVLFINRFWDPQPDYSAFREASYGHSTLELRNRTHAFYHWNRNDDGKNVKTDSVIFHNQYW